MSALPDTTPHESGAPSAPEPGQAPKQAPIPAEPARAGATRELLRAVILDGFPGRVALASSFGAEAAVLLDLVASVDPATPVIFLDTEKHFGETHAHRAALVRRLGLRDVRSVRPDSAALAAEDPDGMLFASRPDRCCYLRKVAPLERALAGFDAWITGRRRAQGGLRGALPLLERVGGRAKINPLAAWTAQDIEAYRAFHDLPRHPLVADGFLSIGCMPCTDRVTEGEDARDGRWRGRGKTECGIHTPLPRAS